MAFFFVFFFVLVFLFKKRPSCNKKNESHRHLALDLEKGSLVRVHLTQEKDWNTESPSSLLKKNAAGQEGKGWTSTTGLKPSMFDPSIKSNFMTTL